MDASTIVDVKRFSIEDVLREEAPLKEAYVNARTEYYAAKSHNEWNAKDNAVYEAYRQAAMNYGFWLITGKSKPAYVKEQFSPYLKAQQ